jgi:hypothetical protein
MATKFSTMNWRDYVGRFSVEFEVANHKDVMLAEEGFLPQSTCAAPGFRASLIPKPPASSCLARL